MAKPKTEKKDDEKVIVEGKELDETKEEKTGTGENTEQETKEVEKEAEVTNGVSMKKWTQKS
ncbi:hypothetical protein [Sebaldella sp. S0638]|uniref:hypothetical protein n=1 Tax=Sebaldella sp. S0638 TaxID=2957809 RepID=UPI00209CCCB2|nr:hypothetical protein [Sebaldella sp. S0638]MCP1226256.1 hypothetical protein [Sebaldella sp. S0638]